MKDYIETLEGLSKNRLILMLAQERQRQTQGIAITGMGCRLPGGIESPGEFWAALSTGRPVAPAPAVDSTGRPRWNPAAPDLAPFIEQLSRGAYLRDVDLFDADYFGIDHQEALHMDPQQRLLLMCAAEAVEDAGISPEELSGRRVGVFTGVSLDEYHQAMIRNGYAPEGLSKHIAAGASISAVSGRIALALGLSGPGMTVDTACSSALTALHLACAAIRQGECDLAIVGACHLLLTPWTAEVFARSGMLSSAGAPALTPEADGYIRAEGCGAMVIRPLIDVPEGSPPYAVVRGTAIHQQGRRRDMTTTSGVGQKRVIEDALRRAGVKSGDVQYVEGHLSGPKLGSVIEVETLAAAYARGSTDSPRLYLGSCKGNLGNMESAAGIGSLMKAALALYHRQIPPQVGSGNLDPDLNLPRYSIRVPESLLPWPEASRRLAGVSAFGYTGANAHVILEGADRPAERGPRTAVKFALKRFWPEMYVWS